VKTTVAVDGGRMVGVGMEEDKEELRKSWATIRDPLDMKRYSSSQRGVFPKGGSFHQRRE